MKDLAPRFAVPLGVSQKAVHAALGSLGGRRPMSPRLRHCPECIAFGFHSTVHQFVGTIRCPAHGDYLKEGCTSCGHTSPYRLDAKLLGSPYQCPHCKRPYRRSQARMSQPLPSQIRTAITRAFFN
jgi:hypothetical protein